MPTCSAGRMLIVATTIICCAHLLGVNFENDHTKVIKIFALFTLNPDIERKKCPEIDILLSFLSKNEEMKYVYCVT